MERRGPEQRDTRNFMEELRDTEKRDTERGLKGHDKRK